MERATAHDLLRYFWSEGFTIQADGKTLLVSPVSRMEPDLKARVRQSKAGLLAELCRENVERLLDLVPVDPDTGLPDLPADEAATVRQIERLHTLADHPAFGSKRKRVREIVEEAIDKDLSQLGAFGLLAELGTRIDEEIQT